MEFHERHVFQSHAKAWGQAHTGPGIRFVSEDDAIQDPDHRGFWTTLSLWNKWRDQTYRNDRDTELQYLDQLPAVSAANASSADKQSPAGARVKQYFTLHSEGTQTVSGTGKMAGHVLKCMFWACNKEGCARGKAKPIKQIGSGTADLFSCQPALAQELRVASTHSPARIGEDGKSASATHSPDRIGEDGELVSVVAAKTPTADHAPDVHTCINPTFGVWSCCLVKKIYFTLFHCPLSEGQKARTLFHCFTQ